jgi:hypothetical protein
MWSAFSLRLANVPPMLEIRTAGQMFVGGALLERTLTRCALFAQRRSHPGLSVSITALNNRAQAVRPRSTDILHSLRISLIRMC